MIRRLTLRGFLVLCFLSESAATLASAATLCKEPDVRANNFRQRIAGQTKRASRANSRQDARRLARFEKQIEQLRSLLKIPGLAGVIIKDQKVLWTRGFGYADLEKRIPASPQTLFHVASLTKTFAATILMQLVEQSRLDLDEPMSRYSNEFKDDTVKIKHVLSHTSSGTPGERFRYDGARYSLLTAVIEKKTGKSFRELLVQMFLDPLQMVRSVPGRDVLTRANKESAFFSKDKLHHYRAVLRNPAQPYRLHGEEIVHTGYGWGGVSASAGLLTTALDIAKFDMAIDNHAYLRKETQETSWTSFVSNSGQQLPHGLGWFVQNYQGTRIVWHFGNDPDSFSAIYIKVPDKALSLILLANSDALSSPFARGNMIRSSALITSFLRIFVFEDAQSRTLPDPNWTTNEGEFTVQLAKLKSTAGTYSYDAELASYKALARWLDERRKQARAAVKGDLRTYDAYVGQYKLPDGGLLTITKERNKLMADIADYTKSELFQSEDKKFFLKSLDGEWTFIRNAEGKVTHIDLVQGGRTFVAKKVR